MSAPGNQAIRLEVHQLAFTRSDRVLFSDLSFALEPGQVLQIEGHNGSGKTTLLRTLCALSTPSDGEVRWCGENIRKVLPDYLEELAYVGHIPGVKEELTPLENLAFAQAITRPRPGIDAESALERIGLPVEHEDIPCRKLSAGQRRRVALARLLMSDARLWVLDEPFTALDRVGRKMVEQMLRDHASAGGMAVITTHHTVSLDNSPVQHLHLS